ncbi:MAG: 16S rRNA (guanine(527)-N(7))-methyltransferase RsmG [Caldilineaceae bacterium]|nr:16S rRNA (guanine(527)-N(7))-methyltransferase RsmG [Caldilineaceae bacterium]
MDMPADESIHPDMTVGPSAQDELTLLTEGCRRLGIPLSATERARFQQYFVELAEWNQHLNLTAIVGYEEVQTKHFLDSLVSLPLIAEELNDKVPLSKGLRLVDVGTGAGFPGIPLKIVSPSLDLTLMDGTQKKISFLRQLVEKLSLTPVHIVHGRAEELGRTPEYRAAYDLVTARAVAPLNTLVEYLLPLTRQEGLVIVYKGPSAPEEFIEARRAIKVLGGETVRFAPVQVPFLPEQRHILLIKKIQPTPAQYPRGQGLARKKPIV